ncbi:MAG: type II toxin-antitoxin system RelE/ParE family toxin [Candidatus Schekmanbacteria bacterium]|nr:type II toxin-antitoxin system RelE/ParE family toxin [Candidatus Schekmanbacteria bacterium]
MNRPVVLRSAARQDLKEARGWYETIRRELGMELHAEVREVIGKVRAKSEMYHGVFGDVRRACTRRFPYAVYYAVKPERIVILAVLHGHRDPAEARRRR